ncbi:10190_t:CDS:2, partial [Funneliformis mosseae]
IEPKDSSPQIINGEDLVKFIPNLYRLLELYKDYGSNGFGFLKEPCDDMVPLCFKSISEINYTKLNSTSVRLIDVTEIPSIDNSNKPFLRPGIYLLVVNPDFGLVIHWPEVGCYDGNAPSQCKKNMINLHKCDLL